MSEQEEKSGGGAGPNTSVVMVESSTNKYKKQFRPTEMQDESLDLHRKRSRAPAVPSVAEELKNISQDTTTNENAEIMERKDSEGERKRRVSKKLSSSTKKRSSSPETITLQPIELDTKKGTIAPFSQPIPPEVQSLTSAPPKVTDIKEVKELGSEKSSVSEDIAELRTETKEHTEWSTQPVAQKKEISWNDNEYLDKVHLQDIGDRNRMDLNTKSQMVMLEGKASVGPCIRPFKGPSGITLCLPKKSTRNFNGDFRDNNDIITIKRSVRRPPARWTVDLKKFAASGLMRMRMIKPCMVESLSSLGGQRQKLMRIFPSASHVNEAVEKENKAEIINDEDNEIIEENPHVSLFRSMKEILNTMCNKIKQVF